MAVFPLRTQRLDELLIIGPGSLIRGTRRLGVGREQVPLTVLFVLIIGGPEATASHLENLAYLGGVPRPLDLIVDVERTARHFPTETFRDRRISGSCSPSCTLEI